MSEEYTGLGAVGVGSVRSYHKGEWDELAGTGLYLTYPLSASEKRAGGPSEGSFGINHVWSSRENPFWQFNITPPLFRQDSVLKLLTTPAIETDFRNSFAFALQMLVYADILPSEWSVRFGGSAGVEGGRRWIKTEPNSYFYSGVARINLEYKW